MAFSFVGRIGAFRKSNPWCNQPGPRHPSPTSPQCSPGAAVLSLGHRPLGLAVPYSCPALHHIAGSPVWAQSSPTPAGLPWAAWQRGLWRFVFVPSPLTPPGLSSQPKYCVIHLLTNRCLGPSQNGSSRRQEAGLSFSSKNPGQHFSSIRWIHGWKIMWTPVNWCPVFKILPKH